MARDRACSVKPIKAIPDTWQAPTLVNSLTKERLRLHKLQSGSASRAMTAAEYAIDSSMLPCSVTMHSSLLLCKMPGCKTEQQICGRADPGGLSVVLVRMITLSSKGLTKTPVSFTKLLLHLACPVNPHLRHPNHAYL